MTDEHNDQNAPPRAGAAGLDHCASCDAPMRADQRYCLECGARRGAPRLDFAAFWQRGADARSSADGTSRASTASANRRPAGSPPSRKLGAALACVVLAAGVAVGDLVGPGPASSLASAGAGLPVGVLGAIAAAQSASDSAKATAGPKAGGTNAGESPTSAGEVAKEAAAAPETESSETSREAAAEAGASGKEAGASTRAESEEPGSESAGGSPKPSGGGSSKKRSKTEVLVPSAVLQQVKYVWMIDLSGSTFQKSLAKPATDPYLAKQLVPKGTLLSDYSLVAASPLANDVALLSGQGSNADIEEDCPTYTPIEPPTVESKGLTEGVGCVYPAAAKTLADQATEATLTWRAYVQGMAPATGTAETSATTTSTTSEGAATPAPTAPSTATATESTSSTARTATGPSPGEASTETCRHPALGGSEPSTAPSTGSDYLLDRNPFVFFDSLLESGACNSDDVDLTALGSALAEPKQTPNLSWIVPAACDDGSQVKCGAGSSGLAAADRFLKEVVPKILASKDYRAHGLVVVTFDSGPAGKRGAPEPNARVGALLVSPFVRAHNTDTHTFTTYSLLASLERLYGVPLLGHANDEGLEELGAGVYSASATAAGRRHAVKQSG